MHTHMSHQLRWEGSRNGGKWLSQLLPRVLSILPVSGWKRRGEDPPSSLTTLVPEDVGWPLDVILGSPVWSVF